MLYGSVTRGKIEKLLQNNRGWRAHSKIVVFSFFTLHWLMFVLISELRCLFYRTKFAGPSESQ
jgi:hypothetical protein